MIFTNCAMTVPYFSLMEHDLFLPRLLKHNSSNKYLSFQELMSPPTSMFWTENRIRNAGLYWVENTPEELEAVTKEMLERTKSPSSKMADDELQRRFKALAKACGKKHDGGRPVKAFAHISRDFLQHHADLLEGAEFEV